MILFLLERTCQDLSNNIKINFHTAHARNIQAKKTVITRFIFMILFLLKRKTQDLSNNFINKDITLSMRGIYKLRKL